VSVAVYLGSLGRAVPPEQATVSVFDRGFLYGDSLFETLRTAEGRPLDLEAHLERLRSSAAYVHAQVPWSDAALADALAQAHAATGNAESVLRLIVTRGRGPLMLDIRGACDPELVVIARPLVLPSEAEYQRGLAVVCVTGRKSDGRLLDARAKVGNYLPHALALAQATDEGADDAVLVADDGAVLEGPTANVFLVRDGQLATPPIDAGVLPGITREVVLTLARAASLHVAVRRVTADELRRADEALFTSSVRGVMAITRVDGRSLGDSREGPLTRALRSAWAAYVAARP
jgi:branched-chain amino acid aminotransferase